MLLSERWSRFGAGRRIYPESPVHRPPYCCFESNLTLRHPVVQSFDPLCLGCTQEVCSSYSSLGYVFTAIIAFLFVGPSGVLCGREFRKLFGGTTRTQSTMRFGHAGLKSSFWRIPCLWKIEGDQWSDREWRRNRPVSRIISSLLDSFSAL